MNYEFCTRTDPGRVRANTEDSVLFDGAAQLAILADGMGGYNAGEVASSMATSLIHSELTAWLCEDGQRASGRELRHALEHSVAHANRSIFGTAATNAHCSGMGTTLVLSAFRGDCMVLGHIGDSRCYRWRQGRLELLTRDHSLVQEQVDAGLLTPQQAAVSSNRNLLTRALGVEHRVLLDVQEQQVQPDDVYLMCSDGLSDMVSDAQIAELLATEAPLDTLATCLVDAANANGGRDNISVLLARARSAVPRPGLLTRWLRQ